jgi:carbon storage regulator CsrA
MLVISRRMGEGIVINGNVAISVVKIGKGRVRLGVVAPPSVRIHRQEKLPSGFEDLEALESLGGSSLVGSMEVLACPPE